MERKYENMARNKVGWLRMVYEGLLSNLPILVCGLAVALALVSDVTGR